MRQPFTGARYQRKSGARDTVTVLRNDVRYFGEPGVLVAFDSCALPRPWYHPDGTARFNAEQFLELFRSVDNVIRLRA